MITRVDKATKTIDCYDWNNMYYQMIALDEQTRPKIMVEVIESLKLIQQVCEMLDVSLPELVFEYANEPPKGEGKA